VIHMDRRMSEALDRHITENYGEDSILNDIKNIRIDIEVLSNEFKIRGIPDKTRELLEEQITAILRGAFISVGEISIQY